MGVPTNPVLTENRREGGFVVWDPSDGMLTREAGVLLAGSGVGITGLVCAALIAGGVAVSAPLGTNVGNGVMGAIVVSNGAKVGDYKLIMVEPNTNAGAFIVEDPTGQEVGHGNVGTAYAAGGLAFTLADGATDFVAGDSFTITVTGATKYAPYDPTAADSRQVAAAILWSSHRDATANDRRAVFNVRGPMKVQAAELEWGVNVTTPAHKAAALAQLAKVGILSV